MQPERLLLTGAAGEIGRGLRPALRGVAEKLRWHDLRAIEDAAPDEEAMSGDLTVPGAAETATDGVDCVIHLAGIPRETGATPKRSSPRRCGTTPVRGPRPRPGTRVIFASSNQQASTARAGVKLERRPTGIRLSGFREAWARYAKTRHEFSALRIGAFRARAACPAIGAWNHPRDMAQLGGAAGSPAVPFLV